jgi:hypothetical protein
VLGPEVARADGSVHVGSTVEELVRGLGPLVEDADHARDPRLVVPSALHDARIVLDRDRIAAIVIASDRSPVKLGPQPEPTCKRPESTAKRIGACLSSAGEIVEIDDDELVIRPPDAERTLHTLRAPGLVFAAPLRNPADGRDELIVVARVDEPHRRTWTLAAYRLEGGRLVRALDDELYDLSSAQSRWIGADQLRDVDLYLELASRPDSIEVGGLLTTRAGERIRDVAPLTPKTIARRHHKSPAGEPQEGKGASASGSAGSSRAE